MDSVIFDLDGTLADTSGDLIAAANACFRDMGKGAQLDPEADRAVAFNGGRAMLRLGFSRLGLAWTEADVSAHFDTLLAHYSADIDRHTRLYDGVVPMLGALHEAGYALGVCTNKPEALALTLLVRLGLDGWFKSVIGADTLAWRKPDPRPLCAAIARLGGDPSRAVLIGDTRTDFETARAAGLPVVLVGFGPAGREVAALGPDALLAHFDDLPAIVARLLPGRR